jgi:uncharacterized protein YndB with AHSA1/START domain
MATTAPKHVFEIYIRTTPEKLWSALTDGKETPRYFFGTRVAADWKAGAAVTYHSSKDGTLMVQGKVVEVDAPRRLVTTWHATYSPETAKERPSRVTWTIQPMGPICKLSVVHDDFDGETSTWKSTGDGWPLVLSALKTYLETGESMPFPPM